jgi:hypothetical protein
VIFRCGTSNRRRLGRYVQNMSPPYIPSCVFPRRRSGHWRNRAGCGLWDVTGHGRVRIILCRLLNGLGHGGALEELYELEGFVEPDEMPPLVNQLRSVQYRG